MKSMIALLATLAAKRLSFESVALQVALQVEYTTFI